MRRRLVVLVDAALANTRSALYTGVPAVIALANGTYEIDPGAAQLLFDADTTASEVRLIGEGGAELVSTNLSAPLLRVGAGAPP